MKKLLASPIVAAVLGGGVTAGVLLGAGVVDSGDTTTVYQQSPLASTQNAADDAPSTGLTAREIYRRDAPGVVFIQARALSPTESPFDFFGGGQTPDQDATGSGFVIDDEGHILTNAHVVSGATNVTVRFGDKRTREAEIVGKDDSTDLALLKVDPKDLDLQPLELGDSKSIQVGDPTIAIGNPFGFDRTLTTGVVSALQREIRAPDGYTIENVIQTDAAINPGNSGGPLIDATGRVIGINSQIATGGSRGSVGIGFAVPIDTAKEVVAQLKDNGRVERPWLGLQFLPIDESLEALNVGAESGLLVQEVVPSGPASRAGIRGGDEIVDFNGMQVVLGGDVITRIGDRDVRSEDDVRAALAEHEPGDEVAVELQRDGDEQTVEVTLGDRPAGKSAE